MKGCENALFRVYEIRKCYPNVTQKFEPAFLGVLRGLGVSEQTYYRWRKEYGGMKISQAKRLKDLERENTRLKKAVADLTLDKLILQEALEGNY